MMIHSIKGLNTKVHNAREENPCFHTRPVQTRASQVPHLWLAGESAGLPRTAAEASRPHGRHRSTRAAWEMAWRLGKNRSCSISDLNVATEAYIAVNHYYFHMGNEMFKRRPERITIHAHVSKRKPQNRLRHYVLAPLLASSVTSDKSLSFRLNL